MIGKPISGKSFGGCVRYVLDRQEAKILQTEGVRAQNSAAAIQDFNLQRKMRPTLGKAVGHIVLSWSREDLPKLSDAIMAARAREYMEKMGIRNTQYLIVRHSDKAHPHLHLIYNRVDNNGNTIGDRNNYARNIKACREITQQYGYHMGEGKSQVNRQALRGKEKVRYGLYDAIRAALKTSTGWHQLEADLKNRGIAIAWKYRSGTEEVQGISFEKDGIKMKGSAIDRSLSYGRINAQLERNLKMQQYHGVQRSHRPSLADQLRDVIRQETQPEHLHVPDGGKSLLAAMLDTEFAAAAPDPVGDAEKRRRKRKKHEAEHSRGMGR